MNCFLATTDALHLAGFLAGVCAAASLLFPLLRRWGISGSGVLAGVVAGFLLGPTLLGRMAPDWFERVVIGGQEERRALDIIKGEQMAREHARRELGLPAPNPAPDSAAGDALDEELARELRAQELWQEAQWRDRRPARIATLVLAGAFFLAGGLTRPRAAGPAPHIYQALSIGLWSAIIPACLFLIVLRWLEVELAAALAACSAAAAGAITFATADLEAADHAEVGGARLILFASRIAMLAAVILLALALILLQNPARSLLAALPVMALAAGWLLPRVQAAWLARARDIILVPSLTALLAMRIEFLEHLSLWMIVAAIALCGDGRWFGAFLGAMLSGARRSLRTMRLVLGVLSAGTAQIGFAAITLHAGLIAEEPAYALLAGALVMELTTNARRGMAQRIEATEEEMEEIRMSAE